MICIWRLKDFAKLSLEHAIPEGLACQPELELRDVACTGCNNGLINRCANAIQTPE